MASYSTYQKLTGRPTFRLDLPHRFKEELAVDYYVGEIRKMIRFLEENTSGRLDWDRLKDVCRERNRAMEHELDLWDLIRHKPAPFGGELIFMGRLVFFTMVPGREIATETYRKLANYARQAVQTGDLPDESSRVLLWNPPTFMFPELFTWAEDRFGVSMIMDMLSFNRHPIIDISSADSMLRDLARIYMQGPMARHTLGPVDYFFEDLFFAYEHFSADTVWMAAHQGCKNTQGLLGMMREKCRERRIPLLVLDTDLGDDRIVSADEIKAQVNRFMETMKSPGGDHV
jgi:benzoyl-CoA reductase/2-hydroxyglutaryl-CoA dehydratase subunit BcrC/BadD/HgdB